MIRAALTFGLILASPFVGCSTSKVVLNEKEFSAHSGVDFETVRFRRPSTPLYDVEAGVGSKAPTKELGTLDCERSEEFFGKLNLAAIRACLSRTPSPEPGASKPSFKLEWTLRKEGQPVLELRDPESAPECFRAALSEIPFPRELMYVVGSDDLDRGECFTSRLALDPGVLLGWELPRSRIRLRVAFPLRETPKTDRDVERMLRAWTLSIYRGGSRENGEFHGRFLPVRYCLKCLGIPEFSERGAARVPAPTAIWPFRSGPESVR